MNDQTVDKKEAIGVLNYVAQKIGEGLFGDEMEIEKVLDEIDDEMSNAVLNR